MAKTFLTREEIHHLNRLPETIPQADLIAYFQLSQDDLHLLATLRGAHNRLGFVLQLCSLRYLGFLPTDIPDPLSQGVVHLAKLLGVTAASLDNYGKHESTLYQHQQMILRHLSFRRASPLDLILLEAWLLDRALEHDKPKLLFELACDYLRRNRIVRPGVTQLIRLVGTARVAAEDACYRQLQPQLTREVRNFLDSLLMSESSWSRLPWLQRTPRSNTATTILQTLDKLAFLDEHRVVAWRLDAVNPNRLKWLAKRGSRASAQGLKAMKASVRYPILMAFLQEAHVTFTDAVIEMVDQRLWELYSEAKREFRDDRLAATKRINETLTVFKLIGNILADTSIDDATVRRVALERLREGQLEQALGQADRLIRPENDDFSDYFAKRHRKVQRFSRRFLSTMQFHASSHDAGLLEGLRLVGEIHAGQRRKLPSATPTAFVPASWTDEIFTDGGLNWRSYEIAALWVLRQKLRSGDVYAVHSRRFTELERYLIPKGDWAEHRKDVADLLGAPLQADTVLKERFAALRELASCVERLLQTGRGDIREQKGAIVVAPLELEQPSLGLKKLRRLIDQRLPRCSITDVLVEVDTWTRFTEAFEHLDAPQRPDGSLLIKLYACLLAQACNIGFKPMADAAELPYHQLLWCNRWYFRDETLDEAVAALINYHHRLPFSDVWGGGMLSSSDGQRFPVRGNTRRARTLPRYFGYGQGVTFYTWTSDQFSQYGSKVIPSTIRDATYVLDAILDNETDLDIVEHTTDTAGYTELVFALFGLLGLTFSPRIRDLADQQLYRPGSLGLEGLPKLRTHLSATLNEELIRDHWGEMLRYTLSLKKGYCTASLIIKKLQAYPRQHPIMRALQEYGRLEKTIHILRWYEDIYTRQRVSKQLNKGEALHRLRAALLFGKHGEIDGLEDEPLDLQAACLNLVTNAVIVFNTRHMGKIIEDLRAEGHDIHDDDIARLWPSRFAHINFLGKYHFDPDKMRSV